MSLLFAKYKPTRLINHIFNKSRVSFSSQTQTLYPFAERNGLSQQLMHGKPCDFICCETDINELQSPSCIINLDVVESNCRQMESIAAKHNLNLRCHVKTHKTLEIAEMQLRDQTDKRIEVSTIPEAYFFADKGFNDILYGIILSESKFKQIEQISALQSPNVISVMTDSVYLTQKMIDYAKYIATTSGFKWNIYIKLDSGTQRAGFDISPDRSIQQTEDLLKCVNMIKDNDKYCRLHGVYQYSGGCYVDITNIRDKFESERILLNNTINEIENECNVKIPIISSGSTPSCMVVDNWDGINEIHPGNYVFFDKMQYEFGVIDDLNSIPISVLTRIIGVYPHRNEILVDCGNVSASLDHNKELLANQGYGGIKDYPNLKLHHFSQEVGKITTIDGSNIDFNQKGLQLGDSLRIIPHHSCLMACQHPYYYITNDDDKVIDIYHKVGAW